jgi:hypothetical protein
LPRLYRGIHGSDWLCLLILNRREILITHVRRKKRECTVLSFWQIHVLRSGVRRCVFSKLSIGHWRVYCTVDWCVWGEALGFLFVFRKERFTLRFLLLSATCWLFGEFTENFTFSRACVMALSWSVRWQNKMNRDAYGPNRMAKMKTKGHFSGLISMLVKIVFKNIFI